MARRGDTVELAVLGLLHENPMHGYELRKQLTVVLGWGRVLSYGSLYPALKKMLRAGWLREHVVAPESGAPSSSGAQAGPVAPAGPTPGRRQRITYELTPEGYARFAALTADSGPSSWEDDVFGVRFAFFGRTDRETRLRILEGRRTRLEERLERVKKQIDHLTGNDTYTAELQRHGLESVEREVRWLSGLIDRERDDRPPAPDPTP